MDSLDRNSINITLHYEVNRVDGKTVGGEQVIALDGDQRATLRDMINGTANSYFDSSWSVHLPQAFVPFIVNKATGLETVTIQDHRMAKSYMANCSLTIVYNTPQSSSIRELPYWGIECDRIDISQKSGGAGAGSDTRGGMYFDIQSRKIVQEGGLAGALSSFGIITFYTTFVLAVGRLLRSYVTGLAARIFYEDLDDPDLLYSFCQECYLARAVGDLELEQILVEQLIDIYRDTALLKAWTRRRSPAKEDQ